jgi:hypothetical protein
MELFALLAAAAFPALLFQNAHRLRRIAREKLAREQAQQDGFRAFLRAVSQAAVTGAR